MIEHKPHPRGEKGTKTSIAEIVKRASEGRLDPRVRAWSMEALKQAQWPDSKEKQAQAILRKLRAERHYVEDPVDAEYMPSAACTLEGCQGLVFFGEDCDGLLIAFLAAIESVGIEGAVLAHSYSPNLATEHVLAASLDGQGKWHRCDPSTAQPWDVVTKPTRESMTLIPSGKTVCDQHGWCDLDKMPSNIQNLRATGDFVGVGRPNMTGTMGAPSDASTSWPDLSISVYRSIVDWLTTQMADLYKVWDECLSARKQLLLVRSKAGMPLLDAAGTEGGWTDTHEQFVESLGWIIPTIIGYAEQVIDGTRAVALDPTSGESVVIGNEGEPQVFVEAGSIVLKMKDFLLSTPEGGNVKGPSGQVGGGWVVAGAMLVGIVGIVVVGLTIYNTTIHVTALLRDLARNRMHKQIVEYMIALTEQGYTQEQAMEMASKLLDDSAAAIEAEKKSMETDTASNFLDTLKVGLYVAAGIGVLVAGTQLIGSMSQRRA